MTHFNQTHGHTLGHQDSPTYQAWISMKRRCNNPSFIQYKDYGGRGIKYDPAWEIFENFLADMGERPEHVDAWSLDRIDNDRDYCKENCRWASPKQQSNNRRIRNTNKSGVTGVSWNKRQCRWVAQAQHNGRQITLYKGASFDAAVEQRKFWENTVIKEILA